MATNIIYSPCSSAPLPLIVRKHFSLRVSLALEIFTILLFMIVVCKNFIFDLLRDYMIATQSWSSLMTLAVVRW